MQIFLSAAAWSSYGSGRSGDLTTQACNHQMLPTTILHKPYEWQVFQDPTQSLLGPIQESSAHSSQLLCIVWNCSNKLHSPLRVSTSCWVSGSFNTWSKPTTRVACWVRIGTEAKTAVRILNGALINKAGFCGATTWSEGLLPQHLMKKDGMVWKCWVAPWICVCHIFPCFTLSYQTFMEDPADLVCRWWLRGRLLGKAGNFELFLSLFHTHVVYISMQVLHAP